MGDPLSAATAIFTLPGIFISCVQCFELIQTARNRGRDLIILQNQFSNQRVRFTKWGEACGFGSGEGYDRRLNDPTLRTNILDTMQSIQMLLNDGAAIVQKHSDVNEDTTLAVSPQSGASRWSWTVIKTRLRKGARDSKDGLIWSVEEKGALEAHVASLYRLIGDLERFTNYLGIPARQRKLVQYEIESINDHSVLETIQDSAVAGDDMISDIASVRLSSLRSSTKRAGLLSFSSSAPHTDASSYRTAPEHVPRIGSLHEIPPEGVDIREVYAELIVKELIASSILYGAHFRRSISDLKRDSVNSGFRNETEISLFVKRALFSGRKYKDIIEEAVAPFIAEECPWSMIHYKQPYGSNIRELIAPSVTDDRHYESIIRYLVTASIRPRPPEKAPEGQNERIIRELIASSPEKVESQLRLIDISRSGEMIAAMDFKNFDIAMKDLFRGKHMVMNTPLPRDATRRVMRDIRNFHGPAGAASRQSNDPAWTNIHPIAEGIRCLLCTFEGPPGTPFAGGLFHFMLCMNDDCPYSPPVCRAITRIYHPNINSRGEICISFLQDEWNPIWMLNATTVAIAALLDDPGLINPLVPEIAELYIRDREMYEKNAKRYTQLYANPEALFNEEGYERCFRMCCDAAEELERR